MVAELPAHRRRLLRIWIVSIALAYLVIGAWAVSVLEEEKSAAARNHRLRLDANAVEPGRTPPDRIPAEGDFAVVNIGIYLDGIENLSIRDSSWTGDFYIWFKWKGDRALDPGGRFRIVDGTILQKELLDSHTGADGVHYQRYKVLARFTKFFNTTRVPLDDHMLNIYVEDASRDASVLRYAANSGSNVSSRVRVPGYRITGFGHVVKPHTYKSVYEDPRVTGGKRATYSEYNFAVTLKRSGADVYLKLFTGLFAGVFLTLASFFVRPSDTSPRFGMPSAAYFGAVANTYLVFQALPSGQFGLADFVTMIGLFTISLCVIASLVSAHFYLRCDEKELSRRLDWASFITIGTGFLLVNVALPLSAYF